jgi:F0F1-type ATP synthase epsilon subunit
MSSLKIRVFKGDDQQPETTITIPGGILKIASKLIPRQATAALQDKGIDIDEIVRLSDNPDVRGTLVEIEEHKKNEKVVIALE